MDVLARAALNAQAKEARRLVLADPAAEAPGRLTQFISNTISVIAIGLSRFDEFGQLGLYKRIGLEPEPEIHDALMQKIANARPIIERVARDFMRQQHDDGAESASSTAPRSPAPPSGQGWQTTRDVSAALKEPAARRTRTRIADERHPNCSNSHFDWAGEQRRWRKRWIWGRRVNRMPR